MRFHFGGGATHYGVKRRNHTTCKCVFMRVYVCGVVESWLDEWVEEVKESEDSRMSTGSLNDGKSESGERERSSMPHVCVLCMDPQTRSAWMNINSACVKVCKCVCLVFRRSSAPARSAAELIHLTVPVQQSIHSHWQHNTLSLSLMRDSINPHTHCTVRHSLQPTAVSTAHTHLHAGILTHAAISCQTSHSLSFSAHFEVKLSMSGVTYSEENSPPSC